MQVKRNELIGLLRAHETEETAKRAEQSLPVTVDLDRDSALLRQLGVDPRVLSVLLSTEGQSAHQTGSLPPPSAGEEGVVVDHPSAAGSSGTDPAAGSTIRGWRVADGGDVAPESLGQLSQDPNSTTGQLATTRRLTREDAEREVVHMPASWCPRCRLRFASIDLMLDHLNREHLRSTSANGLHLAPTRPRVRLSTSEIDSALDEIGRAFQAPVLHGPVSLAPARQRPRRQSLLSVIGPLLLVIGIVTVIAGEALCGVTLIILAVLVAAVVLTVRRRPVVSRTRSELCEEEG